MQVDATQLFNPLGEDEFADIYVSGMSVVQSIEVFIYLFRCFSLVISHKCLKRTPLV